MKKLSAGILCLILLAFFTPKVSAAGLEITAPTKTVTQGGSIVVTVRASGLAGKFSITSSNGNVLSGGTSSEWIENGSKSYKFSAKSIGSATITVRSLDVSSTSGQKYTGSKSITINVVKPREKSNNNYLSSLSVEGYSITPEFSKDQLEYSLEVPAETEKIQINANKADGYASLDGTGEKEVSEGDNRFEIKVTSETGKERIYIVNVNVKDNNPILVEIDNVKYTVVKKASLLEKPELFEEKKLKINEVEVPGFYNEISNLNLVGLRGEDGKISLYIYNEQDKSYTKYQPLTSASISIISLPNKEGLKKYSRVEVKLGEEMYEGYQINAKSNYIYLYGLRIDTGKKSWYIYDKEEKTLQLYQEEEAKKIEEEYEEKLKEQKTVIACLAGISILLALIILILVFTRKGSKKKKEHVYEKTVNEVLEKTIEAKEPKIDNSIMEEEDFLDLLVATKVEDQKKVEDVQKEEKEEQKKKKTSSPKKEKKEK